MHITGAKRAREVIFTVLHDACVDGDLSICEAIEAAKDIFSQNSVQFYNIKLSDKSLVSRNSTSPSSMRVKANLQCNVSLVRVIWVDASGQHRCRVSSLFTFYVHFFLFQILDQSSL